MNYKNLPLLALLFITGKVMAEPTTIYGADVVSRAQPVHVRVDMRRLPQPPQWTPGMPIITVPKRRYGNPQTGETRQFDYDPLYRGSRQGESVQATESHRSFEGQGFSGVNPPDTMGAVGGRYFVQAINAPGGTGIAVYDISLADPSVPVLNFLLDTLATGLGACADGLGDPVVLFDHFAQRWLLSEFTAGSNDLCFYLSDTADPTEGGWTLYNFTADQFPDYPKTAIWHDAYYIGSNESGEDPIYAMDRNAMLSGNPASIQRFSNSKPAGFAFSMMLPANAEGLSLPPANLPGLAMRHRDDEAHNPGSNNPLEDYLEIWEIAIDWDTPANSSLTGPFDIAIAEFDSDLCGYFTFSCIPQPDSGVPLDPLREVIMWRLVYRTLADHNSMVGSFVTDLNGADLAAVRWFELRHDASNWTLQQEGLVGDESYNRWMPSISMDKEGNIATAYNVSNATDTYPGLQMAGRLSTDPPGVMSEIDTVLAIGTGVNSSERYGDYNSLSLNESDGCTFWFTGEYNTAAEWSTLIASWRFPGCDNVLHKDSFESKEELIFSDSFE